MKRRVNPGRARTSKHENTAEQQPRNTSLDLEIKQSSKNVSTGTKISGAELLPADLRFRTSVGPPDLPLAHCAASLSLIVERFSCPNRRRRSGGRAGFAWRRRVRPTYGVVGARGGVPRPLARPRRRPGLVGSTGPGRIWKHVLFDGRENTKGVQ